jgi:cytochrome c oxidase assembly protein subunit 15
LALPRLVGLVVLAAAWWPVRALTSLAVGASAGASFDVGQYRHAVDVVFASALMAVLLASVLAPPWPAPGARLRRGERAEWAWIGMITLDIGAGAMFAATNAAAYWPTWPGYGGGHVLPPLVELTSYAPWWLNLTFNPYGIQLAHRVLSCALWIAAAWQLGAALLRGLPMARAGIRFGLISAQALIGIATLVLGVPALLSIVHQVGGIALLAVSLVVLLRGRASSSPLRLAASRAAA